MATNIVYDEAVQFVAVPTAAPGTTAQSGDPVLVGELPGVALTDADDTIVNDGKCTVKTNGAASLSVFGNDGAANAAVAPGDLVYMQADGSLDVDTAGTRFGYALEAVASGTTTAILVKVGY